VGAYAWAFPAIWMGLPPARSKPAQRATRAQQRRTKRAPRTAKCRFWAAAPRLVPCRKPGFASATGATYNPAAARMRLRMAASGKSPEPAIALLFMCSGLRVAGMTHVTASFAIRYLSAS
jgi:hypothetical protein